MQINLHPQLNNTPMTLSRSGDILTINGESFDFSPLVDGDTLPTEAIGSDWFNGPVEKVSGTLHISLILPHGSNAPDSTRFPDPITVVGDGPITLPPYEALE